jgi:hypothetical protein
MRYMLLLYANEGWWTTATDEQRTQGMAAYREYSVALEQAGAFVAGAPLQPSHATTTVSIENGEPLFTDGPFAETKEQLGGYYLIDCDSLDEALEWAARNPNAQWGHVEVRPLMELPAEVSG